MTPPAIPHEPVLARRTVELMRPRPGAVLVDATVGPGGHAGMLLEASAPDGRVYGIDRDGEALAFARRRLERFGDRFVAIHGDYREVKDLLGARGVTSVDGILADLGISSMQLDDPGRGFGFASDGPLDMRMDRSSGPTAADLLAETSEEDLARILWRFGEERSSRAIARAVVRERSRRPLTSTGQLADLVEHVAGPRARRYRIHPATRTFQAIRIAVNGELDGLAGFVADAVDLLRSGGRLAVIAFHSLEDRCIKNSIRSLANRCTCPPRLPVCACGRENLVKTLTKRPVRPTDDDVRANPRARSARLRAAERL